MAYRQRHYQAMKNRLSNGWTKRLFNRKMTEQDKRCAICGTLLVDSRASGEKLLNGMRKLAADHDHVTGLSRGILCHQCNVGIGMLQDNPDILEKAALYLRFHQKKI